jgi:hypothetical protein
MIDGIDDMDEQRAGELIGGARHGCGRSESLIDDQSSIMRVGRMAARRILWLM